MSYTTLYLVPIVGEIESYAEFRNSFRSAYLVWHNMSKKYLGMEVPLHDNEEMRKVWNLFKTSFIPMEDRIVIASTFDRVMVRRTEIPKLLDAISSYISRFDGGNLVDMVEELQKLAEDRVCYAVCWNQTSVSDTWYVRDDDEEDSRLYDISKDEDHWFLFDELERINANDSQSK